MASLLQNVATSDAYTPALTLGPHPDAVSVLLRVGTSPVFVTVWIEPEGQRTPVEEGQERYYNANSIVRITNVYGVKVRSATAGNPSVCTLELVEDKASDPAVEFQATGTATPGAVSAVTQQIFTTATTGPYVIPNGCTSILVECIGGGGPGGDAPATAAGQVAAGGGGAGGCYASRIIPVSLFTNPASLVVNVGASGAPSNLDETAGAGIWVQALGGNPGAAGVAGGAPKFDGAGGTGPGPLAAGQIGTVILVGEPGDVGTCLVSTTQVHGGSGGAAARGGGGGPGGGAAGATGQQYGGGGAGAANTPGGTAKTGGAGGNGVVIITEFYS